LLRADNVSYVHDGRRGGQGAGPTSMGAGFGEPALPGVQDVTIAVERGGIVGILGPNGSGKTTLLRLLAGMLRPECGTVTLNGINVASIARAALARSIAVVPQETHLAFDYSVLEIALMGRYPHLGTFELEGPRDVAVAREALEATGTLGLERRSFATLSGGEKQRVVIASALAQSPELLLLDEPTASLDLGYQFEIATLLARLNGERGTSMIVSTHDLNLAATLCSEMVMLKHGRVLAQGRTDAVLTTDHIRALYGVEADVQYHPSAGHLTVVPIARAD